MGITRKKYSKQFKLDAIQIRMEWITKNDAAWRKSCYS